MCVCTPDHLAHDAALAVRLLDDPRLPGRVALDGLAAREPRPGERPGLRRHEGRRRVALPSNRASTAPPGASCDAIAIQASSTSSSSRCAPSRRGIRCRRQHAAGGRARRATRKRSTSQLGAAGSGDAARTLQDQFASAQVVGQSAGDLDASRIVGGDLDLRARRRRRRSNAARGCGAGGAAHRSGPGRARRGCAASGPASSEAAPESRRYGVDMVRPPRCCACRPRPARSGAGRRCRSSARSPATTSSSDSTWSTPGVWSMTCITSAR